jgi:hypothetical protein
MPVAVDRVRKVAYAELHEKAARRTAGASGLLRPMPVRIRPTVGTDRSAARPPSRSRCLRLTLISAVACPFGADPTAYPGRLVLPPAPGEPAEEFAGMAPRADTIEHGCSVRCGVRAGMSPKPSTSLNALRVI